jgi:uncharacterized protein
MRELTIRIRDIADEGEDLEVALARPFLQDAFAGVDANLDHTLVTARMHLLKTGDNVFVRGDLVGEVELPCVRCLAPARLPLAVPLQLTAAPDELLRDEARDEGGDDVDVFTHDGETLELSPVLREALILALPMTALCRPDCRGLCPVCGGDRNQRACGCEVATSDPRLAALKHLKV